ncbi:cytochrome c oxidase assembly protein [Nakamurella endophytica]|uniref:Copper resistance protein D n=1 Tax=Nakamurella endophytica TaxID=1748367 RepID=A0A917T1I4_9ACTN|nr:cytochrome c oxidase assembly protein [Nakamurella endophytica]GGM06969.1 copper resistance protein D [Nakamurella endophytica]
MTDQPAATADAASPDSASHSNTATGTRALRPRRDGWTVTAVTVAAALVTACIAVGLMALVPSRRPVPGIPDAPALTELALPALKGLFDLMAALTVGWLVAAVALAPPQRSGLLDVGGYRAVRAAALSALVWAATAFALVPVTWSDVVPTGLVPSLRADAFLQAVRDVDVARGYVISGCVALLIGILGWSVLRPGWAGWLLTAAVGALLPLALSGHASSSGDHDVAVDTMIYHLVGVSVWVGGLVAFLGLARQRVPHLSVVARRYSAVALVAFVAVLLSGVGNAWVRLSAVSDLWTTDYGRLISIKAVLLLVLGGIGWLHRRRTLPAVDRGDRRALVRLATVEVLVMAAVLGVAAALARSAPPPPSGAVPSALEDVLGYDLAGPPTPARLLLDWRWDWLLGTGAVVLAVVYLLAVRRLRRRGDAWPVGRSASWLLGCLAVVLATSSGLGRYAQSQFSLHMIEHMTLGMVAPILFVLGAPTTLALRALPVSRAGVPGAREALVAVLNGRIARMMTHPLVVLPLFIGSFYAVYFTGLFDAMMDNHFGHLVMNVHFLVVGYLYYWVIIGIDPAPRRLTPVVKLALLIAAIPFHAFFGLALMNSHSALATGYYQSLDLPWAPNLVADQQLGGGVAWGATELPMLIVLIALVAQWARADDREARRDDRRRDADGDVELHSYNAMLAGLARRSSAAAAGGGVAVAERPRTSPTGHAPDPRSPDGASPAPPGPDPSQQS